MVFLCETPDPRLRPGEVRIRVRACGVNFADLMACYGLYPDAPKAPCIVGYEAAGTIDAAANGADTALVGKRVIALSRFGAHADTVWTILGVKTGIWSKTFLISIATSIFIFAVLLSVVVLIGVLFESAALATMITVGLMIMSPILAQTSTMLRLLSSEWSRQLWRTLYYALPKVYDLGKMTLDAIQSQTFEGYMPIWTSALFGVVMLSAALAVFARRDF